MKRSTLIATVASVLLAVAGNAQTTVSGTIDGHDYVDLGLSVKWATCNVGASSPSDYGAYFAWGETTTKSEYTEENSKTWEELMDDIAGNPQYDAARANWGGSWRMPTVEEIEELCDCTWTWTTQSGHKGYKVTSKINGNSIFFPAAGCRYGSSLDYAGEIGGYWSSSPIPYDFRCQCVDGLGFDNDNISTDLLNRDFGFSVRPVSD